MVLEVVPYGSCADGIAPPPGLTFSGPFGGAVVDGDTYTNPTGSESWAGFANQDTSVYPYAFADGGCITFVGETIPDAIASVYFRFEKEPYPDTEPSFITASTTITSASASYSVDIPPQNSNTFSSFLLYVTTLDVPVTLTNIAVSTSCASD